MKTSTQVIATAIALATLVASTPVVQSAVTAFFSAHPTASVIFAGVSSLLALFHKPEVKA